MSLVIELSRGMFDKEIILFGRATDILKIDLKAGSAI
jgi:hypothetical protein